MSKCQTQKPAKQRVLVVDDNPMMRVILSSMLMNRGFEVVEESCSETALIQLQNEVFDIVMLDIMMFRMSGIELCQIIRNELGLVDLPVVAYTANNDISNVAQMRMAGFNDFLFKPADSAALNSVLREINSIQ